MGFNHSDGFVAGTYLPSEPSTLNAYQGRGFNVVASDSSVEVTASAVLFSQSPPQVLHAYVQKLFGSIPTAFIVEPLNGAVNFSQIGISYLISYFLGMLAR